MDLFKLLTKNSFDIISVLADDGTVKFESDAVEKILGYKPGERIGKSIFDYLHPDDKDYVIKEFSTRDKKVKRLEFRFAHKNGSWIWFEAIGQDFLNDPEVNGILVNSRDISDQKKKQQKLAKSERGYKRLIENSNAFIMEIDADNYKVVSCNQAMAKLLNHSVQNLIGKNIKELLPPEVLSKRIEYGNKALEQNKVQQFEDERDGRCFMNHFIPYTDQERRYIQTITYEITGHWKPERALSDSETRYKELFQFLEEGFLRADKNGIITMANNSIAALAGYESPEELIGLSMNKLYAIPSERSKMLADLKKKGTLRNYEIRLITKSGDLRWSSCNIKFFKNQQNEIAGTEGLVRDITGQKRLEEKLQESQQRFKQFMDHIPGAAFLKDRDNKLLYCNQEYASMLGTTPENLLYEDMIESIPKNLQRIYFQENEDIIKKGKPIVSESEFTAEKELKHWLTYKFPVLVKNETFVGGISIDITDRKKAERDLVKSQDNLSYLNQSLSSVINIDSLDKIYQYMADSVHLLYPGSVVLYVAVDETGEYTINKGIAGLEKTYFEKIERITGFKLMDKRYKLKDRYRNFFISGKLIVHDDTFTEFTKGTFASMAAKAVQKLLGIKRIYTIGVNWEDELLGAIIVLTTQPYEVVEKVFIENYVTHMAAVIRNKKINDQLQKSEAQYRELNATKDKFFSIISHDLKAPFNSILGFSKLINKKIKNNEYDKVNTYCDFINKSAQQSYDLLDNLLQWSRIQTGRMEFKPKKINLKESVDASLVLLSPNYKAKKIEITNEVSGKLEVNADQFMLDTVFRNLISNAIKFTHPKGKIAVRAKQKANEIILEVEDNGIGIDKKEIDHLFNIENSYSQEGTNEEKGTGLGLILCKEFIEKHGGKIGVKSKKDKGTIFFFTIPC